LAGFGLLVGDVVVVLEPVMLEGCPVVAATWWARAARERAKKKVFMTTEMRLIRWMEGRIESGRVDVCWMES
jgi:hypothetical protein